MHGANGVGKQSSKMLCHGQTSPEKRRDDGSITSFRRTTFHSVFYRISPRVLNEVLRRPSPLQSLDFTVAEGALRSCTDAPVVCRLLGASAAHGNMGSALSAVQEVPNKMRDNQRQVQLQLREIQVRLQPIMPSCLLHG